MDIIHCPLAFEQVLAEVLTLETCPAVLKHVLLIELFIWFLILIPEIQVKFKKLGIELPPLLIAFIKHPSMSEWCEHQSQLANTFTLSERASCISVLLS